jgi:hypothetical protein
MRKWFVIYRSFPYSCFVLCECDSATGRCWDWGVWQWLRQFSHLLPSQWEDMETVSSFLLFVSVYQQLTANCTYVPFISATLIGFVGYFASLWLFSHSNLCSDYFQSEHILNRSLPLPPAPCPKELSAFMYLTVKIHEIIIEPFVLHGCET